MLTARDYGKRIYDLTQQKDYRAAYNIVQEGLTLYPTNPDILRKEVYVLAFLDLSEARRRAEENFAELRSDPFFLRTYLGILHRCKAKAAILNLIGSGVLEQKFPSVKPDFYKFCAQIALQYVSREKALEFLRICPPSEEIDNLIDKYSRGFKGESIYGQYQDIFKGKKTHEAIDEMERLRLLSSYKNDFPLHLFLAKKYIQAKKLVEAENIYKYLLALRDDKATRRQMALFYKKTGDTDKAVTLLKDILLKDPYDFGARNSLYSIFKGKGDTVSFEAIVRDVVAAHPDARSFWGKVHNLRKELCHD